MYLRSLTRAFRAPPPYRIIVRIHWWTEKALILFWFRKLATKALISLRKNTDLQISSMRLWDQVLACRRCLILGLLYHEDSLYRCSSHSTACSITQPVHDKTYNNACATSEDSDQPAHPRSLIRVFADRMCLLKPPGYQQTDKRGSLPYWVDVQAGLRLCCSHRSYCRLCRAHTIEWGEQRYNENHITVHNLV